MKFYFLAFRNPIFEYKKGERAKNGGVLGEEIFCPRANRVFLPAAGGGLKISVGIFLKIGSDFNQNPPPIYKRRVFRLAPPLAGLGVCQDFERVFAFC